jgi:hypothetical protein
LPALPHTLALGRPPLVTALRCGHPKALVALLVEPAARFRALGVDEASPADGATAVSLAIRANRLDVLGQASRGGSQLRPPAFSAPGERHARPWCLCLLAPAWPSS